MHEIGHALGLGDTNDSNVVMYEGNNNLTALQSDDILGICTLYGKKPIIGNGSICSTGSTVTFTSPYQIQIPLLYFWTHSSNLSRTSPNITDQNITFNVTSNGAGWVALTPFGVNSLEINRKEIWVGAPLALGSIYTESGSGCIAGTTTYWNTAAYSVGSNIYWGAYTTDYSTYASTTDLSLTNGFGYGSIKFNDPGTYIVSAYAEACGSYTSVVYYSSYFNVYSYRMGFKPESNEIEISVDDGNAARNAGAASKDQFTVTISDGSGIARSQSSYSGKQFTVPVSSLADGTYNVKISNGTITDTQQLVIKR